MANWCEVDDGDSSKAPIALLSSFLTLVACFSKLPFAWSQSFVRCFIVLFLFSLILYRPIPLTYFERPVFAKDKNSRSSNQELKTLNGCFPFSIMTIIPLWCTCVIEKFKSGY